MIIKHTHRNSFADKSDKKLINSGLEFVRNEFEYCYNFVFNFSTFFFKKKKKKNFSKKL